MISDAQLQALEQLFTSERVSVAGDDLAFYGQDWSKFVKPKPAAIVFPTERDEVQQLVSQEARRQQRERSLFPLSAVVESSTLIRSRDWYGCNPV